MSSKNQKVKLNQKKSFNRQVLTRAASKNLVQNETLVSKGPRGINCSSRKSKKMTVVRVDSSTGKLIMPKEFKKENEMDQMQPVVNNVEPTTLPKNIEPTALPKNIESKALSNYSITTKKLTELVKNREILHNIRFQNELLDDVVKGLCGPDKDLVMAKFFIDELLNDHETAFPLTDFLIPIILIDSNAKPIFEFYYQSSNSPFNLKEIMPNVDDGILHKSKKIYSFLLEFLLNNFN